MAYSNEDKAKILGFLLAGYSVETAINELQREEYDRFKTLSTNTVYQWVEKYNWKPLVKAPIISNDLFRSMLPSEVQSIAKDLSQTRSKLQHKLKQGDYKIQSLDKAVTGLAQLIKLELALAGIDLSEMKRNRIMECFRQVLSEDEVIGDLIRERWELIKTKIKKLLVPADEALIGEQSPKLIDEKE